MTSHFLYLPLQSWFGSKLILLGVFAFCTIGLLATVVPFEVQALTEKEAEHVKKLDVANDPKFQSEENIDDIVRRLVIPSSVEITVTDENLQPMKDVRLKVQLVRDKKEFRTDENGKVVVDTKPYQNTELGWFSFEADASDRVSTAWRWLRQKEFPVSIPPKFTIRLEPGFTIGGMVVDEQGKPVVGAKVVPLYDHRGRSGASYNALQLPRPVWEGVLTDAEGKWKAEGYSKTNGQIMLNVTHDDFLPQVEDKDTAAYLMDDILTRNAKTVLKSGFRVFGTVRDDQGNPLLGAAITFDKPGISNRPSVCRTTDKDGQFEIKSWYKKSTDYTVVHRDWAPAFGNFDFASEGYSLSKEVKNDFTLKKGRSIRMKVVDKNGTPIKKYWVCFHTDQPELHDAIPHDPNADGIWEWENAPDTELSFDIDSMKGFDRIFAVKMKPREEPYIVKAKGTTVISGKVIDAETKKPVEKFNFVRGMIRIKPLPGYSDECWLRENTIRILGSFYSINFDSSPEPEDNTIRPNSFRIEAVGYEPYQAEPIDLDGSRQTLDIELIPSKTKPVRAVVLLPNGKPAIDAEVGLGGLSSIAVRTQNDRIACNTGNIVVRTDVQGLFEFPTPGVPYVVLAVHPDGFAFARQTDVETGTVRMIPWARIEGVAYKNGKPAANASLWGSFKMPPELQQTFPIQQCYEAQVEVTTDAAGKFVLERVAPGLSGVMGFVSAAADTHIATESGKTTNIEIKAKSISSRESKISWQGFIANSH